MTTPDTIFLLQNLLSIHSSQCSFETREVKDDISKLIFDLMENLKNQDYENFKKHIFTQPVFCATKDSIEALQKKEIEIYLCSSKNKGNFNTQSGLFVPYKYFYKFALKENTYGIDLNSFFEGEYKITEETKNRYWKFGEYHKKENEVLIRLSDINIIKAVKKF